MDFPGGGDAGTSRPIRVPYLPAAAGSRSGPPSARAPPSPGTSPFPSPKRPLARGNHTPSARPVRPQSGQTRPARSSGPGATSLTSELMGALGGTRTPRPSDPSIVPRVRAIWAYGGWPARSVLSSSRRFPLFCNVIRPRSGYFSAAPGSVGPVDDELWALIRSACSAR
jgi:hypothetical protein